MVKKKIKKGEYLMTIRKKIKKGEYLMTHGDTTIKIYRCEFDNDWKVQKLDKYGINWQTCDYADTIVAIKKRLRRGSYKAAI